MWVQIKYITLLFTDTLSHSKFLVLGMNDGIRISKYRYSGRKLSCPGMAREQGKNCKCLMSNDRRYRAGIWSGCLLNKSEISGEYVNCVGDSHTPTVALHINRCCTSGSHSYITSNLTATEHVITLTSCMYNYLNISKHPIQSTSSETKTAMLSFGILSFWCQEMANLLRMTFNISNTATTLEGKCRM